MLREHHNFGWRNFGFSHCESWKYISQWVLLLLKQNETIRLVKWNASERLSVVDWWIHCLHVTLYHNCCHDCMKATAGIHPKSKEQLMIFNSVVVGKSKRKNYWQFFSAVSIKNLCDQVSEMFHDPIFLCILQSLIVNNCCIHSSLWGCL